MDGMQDQGFVFSANSEASQLLECIRCVLFVMNVSC